MRKPAIVRNDGDLLQNNLGAAAVAINPDISTGSYIKEQGKGLREKGLHGSSNTKRQQQRVNQYGATVRIHDVSKLEIGQKTAAAGGHLQNTGPDQTFPKEDMMTLPEWGFPAPVSMARA